MSPYSGNSNHCYLTSVVTQPEFKSQLALLPISCMTLTKLFNLSFFSSVKSELTVPTPHGSSMGII